MCLPISAYSHITSCSKFHIPADPWARTTSPRNLCLLAPSYSLCPSPAAGSHALSQPCCHHCLLSPEVCFQITQMSPISLSLTSLLLFCSCHLLAQARLGEGQRVGDTLAFTPIPEQEAPVQTSCWCGSVAVVA